MSKRRVTILVVLVVIAAVLATGCVSKKAYRKDIEDTNQKIAAVETGVEDNERRITDLKSETDDRVTALEGQTEKAVKLGNSAVSKADSAQATADKALRGKLLWTVTLSDDRVKFSFGQSELPEEAKAALDELIRKVKGLDKAVFIEVEGYTDNIGSADYNQKLGYQRASTVMQYMAEQGIPLHAMNVISFGEARPAADNSTREGRAANRRVVIKVLE
jgi:outer membrane protein OmpA-like peptidoglycan-associated protein